MSKSFDDITKKIYDLFNAGGWLNIRDAIRELQSNTGKGCIFDPYKDPDRLPWNNIGISFLNSNHSLEALTVFQAQLQSYLDIQEKTKKRIHKGTPYHFLGKVYISIGNLELAREHFLFAFVEDILTEIQSAKGITGIPRIKNALDSPAPIILELTFRMSKKELEDLYTFTKKMVQRNRLNTWLYPEMVILKWRNYKEKSKDTGLLITRAVEEKLFHINSYYLKLLFEKATRDPSGETMEELATYLFSCVDGFEPIPKKETEAYHFDVIVRNLIREHPLLSMLGEYIGIEAKNIKKTVGVEQLNHFIHKLRLHNIRCGIIFTNKGISGVSHSDDAKYGKNIQVKTFNRDNLIVFDVTSDDIRRIIEGNNLISLLLVKYEEIRYK